MKYTTLFLVLILSVGSCFAQGFRKLTRQGEKAFKENDYATATINSIKALQLKPNFSKSIELFENSIIRVNKFYEMRIKQLEAESVPFDDILDVDSAEEIVFIYDKLIQVQNELMFFPGKVKLKNKNIIQDHTKDYSNQLTDARENLKEYRLLAAEIVYNKAFNLYNSANSKQDYQMAFYEFEKISKYVRAYKNSIDLKDECLRKGVIRVGILPPANSSGRTDTRFNVINTVVNQIRTNIGQYRFVEAVNISDRSIGYYSNNYSGINADLVIKITFNDWGYGQRRIKEENYSNEKIITKKDGSEKVFNVKGVIIETQYYANYDVIVEAIQTDDNTIDKSENLIMNFNFEEGFLIGEGDNRANESGYAFFTKLPQPTLSDFNIKGKYGTDGVGSRSSEELFKDAFRNHVSNLIGSWYD